MKRERKPHTIADDTPLIPIVVAETVVSELERYLRSKHNVSLPESDSLPTRLATMAERIYEHNRDERWGRTLRHKNGGREHLYAFMRHWLSGELSHSNIFQYIPHSYRVGHELPQ